MLRALSKDGGAPRATAPGKGSEVGDANQTGMHTEGHPVTRRWRERPNKVIGAAAEGVSQPGAFKGGGTARGIGRKE